MFGGHDVTVCTRCQSPVELTPQQHGVYGDVVYSVCRKCEAAGVYPWDLLLVLGGAFAEEKEVSFYSE